MGKLLAERKIAIKETSRLKNWMAPDNELLPEFIIGGAMKSGTSTLHKILGSHPEIFIPDKEIHFFNMDCLIQHEGFHYYNSAKDNWTVQSMYRGPETMWNWYQDRYKDKKNLIKGEDSTTYLSSAIAAERIAIQEKEIKLIFLLRQPTNRAFSNYYHRLKSGRATYDFEDSIRFRAHSILNRSLYKEQLEHYYRLIPRERIRIILFEDLIVDTKVVVKEISDFIGVDFTQFPGEIFETTANKTTLTSNVPFRTRRNYMLRRIINSRYSRSLPNKHPASSVRNYLFKIVRLLDKVYFKLMSFMMKRKPSINASTKEFLDDFFYDRLQGIDELVDKDILSRWFPDRGE
ncbi:MAG: sulfotransferase domain-containing protein, partial [Flavobacteriales bacterium]|nr:sulfotransferase domain-containing protein [Flavobacteriales bacterium]